MQAFTSQPLNGGRHPVNANDTTSKLAGLTSNSTVSL